MVRAHPEFAAGEFLAFEFASDDIAFAREAAFFGSGQADVVPDSYALANATAGGSGQANAAFSAQVVTPADTSIVGAGVVNFAGSATVGSTFNAPGQTEVVAQSGTVRQATFALTGGCTVQSDAVDAPGFDSNGVATVAFDGASVASSAFNITAQTQVEFVGQGVTQAKVEGQAGSVFDAHAQAFVNAYASGAGASSGSFDSWRTANTSTTIVAGATTVMRGQANANARAQAQGSSTAAFDMEFSLRVTTTFASGSSSTTFFETNALTYEVSEFVAANSTTAEMVGDTVRQAHTHIEGISEVIWRRGRQTFTSLVASPDATVRPEENRVTEWV